MNCINNNSKKLQENKHFVSITNIYIYSLFDNGIEKLNENRCLQMSKVLLTILFKYGLGNIFYIVFLNIFALNR